MKDEERRRQTGDTNNIYTYRIHMPLRKNLSEINHN
jgi:hypothetical protein